MLLLVVRDSIERSSKHQDNRQYYILQKKLLVKRYRLYSYSSICTVIEEKKNKNRGNNTPTFLRLFNFIFSTQSELRVPLWTS